MKVLFIVLIFITIFCLPVSGQKRSNPKPKPTPKPSIQKGEFEKFIKEQDRNEKGETIEDFKTRVRKVFSDDWVWYSTDVSNCSLFYNKNRIVYPKSTVENALVSVWTRTACFRAADMMGNAPEINKALVKADVFYALQKIEINCYLQEVSLEFQNFYDQTEKQIGSMDLEGRSISMEIPPGSTMEALFNIHCKQNK